MPSILLAGDDRLRSTLGAPLESRGWSVTSVHGLSEIADACRHASPDVVLLTVPAASGGTEAFRQVRASFAGHVAPFVVLLPAGRAGEADACRAAGAVDVLISPVRVPDLAKRLAVAAREAIQDASVDFDFAAADEPVAENLADPTPSRPPPRPADADDQGDDPAPPTTPQPPAVPLETLVAEAVSADEAAMEEVQLTPPPPPVVAEPMAPWPRDVPPPDKCVEALLTFQTGGELPAGFERSVLQSLFRGLTDAEVRALRAAQGAGSDAGGAPPEAPELRLLAGHRVRVRLAGLSADRLAMKFPRDPIDLEALASWKADIEAIARAIAPMQQRAVTAGDLQVMRQCVQLADTATRMRRELDDAARKLTTVLTAPAAARNGPSTSPSVVVSSSVGSTVSEPTQPDGPRPKPRSGGRFALLGLAVLGLIAGFVAALFYFGVVK